MLYVGTATSCRTDQYPRCHHWCQLLIDPAAGPRSSRPGPVLDRGLVYTDLYIKEARIQASACWLQGRNEERADSVGARGYCDRPRTYPTCAFWRHFAVLTINTEGGQKQDHLFLVREGGLIWKSWKFKVMVSEAGFETGSMPGLMATFR